MTSDALASAPWPVVPITDMADVNPDGLGVGTAADYRFRYIDLTSAERGQISWGSVRELRFMNAPSRARRIVMPGDVLFGTVRPTLQSHGAIPQDRAGGNLVASTGFAVIRARQGAAEPRYLFHFLLSNETTLQARRAEVGSNYPAVNESDVRRFEILKPPVREQIEIAAVLDATDEAIRASEQVIAKLNLVKHGVLWALLSRGIGEDGEPRDPLRHPEQFEDTPLGRIPKDWKMRRTTDVAVPSVGSTTIGPFGSNLLASDYRPEGVPVVFVRDVREDGFAWTSGVYVSEAKASSLSAHAVEPGDVVITKMGLPPCIAAVYPSWMQPGIVTADVIRLRPNPIEIRADWFAAYMNSAPVRAQVRAITAGVTRPKVTLRDFRNLKVAVPSAEEQNRIASVLATARERLSEEQSRLAKLRSVRDGLREDLITGRMRVLPLIDKGAA